MQLLKSSFWSGLTIVVKSVGSFTINKIFAYYYGPSGFLIFAHFQSFIAILLGIPTDGINIGVIKYLSNKDSSDYEKKNLFYSGLLLNLLFFLLSIAFILIFFNYFYSYFGKGLSPLLWIALLSWALFIQILNFFFLSMLLIDQKLKWYFLFNSLSSIISVLGVYFASQSYSFTTALIISALAPGFVFLLGFPIIKKVTITKELSSFVLPKKFFLKSLSSYVIMALSILVFGKVVDFVLRQYLIVNFSLELTGLWQAVAKLSEYYTSIVVSLIGMIYFPKVAQILNHFKGLKEYLQQILKVYVPIVLLGLFSVYLLRDFFLLFFFNEAFLPASGLFKYQLIGDFFKLTSYVFAYLISAQARTMLFISSQAASALVFIILVYFSTKLWGIEGVPIAHSIRYFFYWLFLLFIYRRYLFK